MVSHARESLNVTALAILNDGNQLETAEFEGEPVLPIQLMNSNIQTTLKPGTGLESAVTTDQCGTTRDCGV